MTTHVMSEIRAGFPFKYGWWWKRVFYWPTRRAYYRLRYRVPVGEHGTMMPSLGRGKFVSVKQRGPFLDLTDERNGELIRLIPYQPNHGLMVEMWRDGKLYWRMHCGIEEFRKMGFSESDRAIEAAS